MTNLSSHSLSEFRKCLNFIINPNYNLRIAGIKYYAPPEPVDDSEWPDVSMRKLKQVSKGPIYEHNSKGPKMKKMLRLLRGPEEVHTDLIYNGYGIKAILGGRLQYKHFEFMRTQINKKLDIEKMFALWRVDPPWQSVTKKSIGKRMGCGKGSIHHYVTPVKAERIVVEIGGDIHPIEAKLILDPICQGLPFPSRIVSQKILDEEREEEKWREENNLNPYTMEYIIRNNMGGCQNWLSKYDYKWLGKYK